MHRIENSDPVRSTVMSSACNPIRETGFAVHARATRILRKSKRLCVCSGASDAIRHDQRSPIDGARLKTDSIALA